jgi:hypothetical protein
MFNEKWKFLAVDDDGCMILYIEQPIKNVKDGIWESYGKFCFIPSRAFHDFDHGKLYKLVGGMPTRTGCD